MVKHPTQPPPTQEPKVVAVAVHPGVVRTELARYWLDGMAWWQKAGLLAAYPLLWLTTKNPWYVPLNIQCNTGVTQQHCVALEAYCSSLVRRECDEITESISVLLLNSDTWQYKCLMCTLMFDPAAINMFP